MREPASTVRILETNLSDHVAAKAWRRLTGEAVRLDRIQVLKEERNHSQVYKLCGIGPGGTNIVAKRCSLEAATVEEVIYQKILPNLPLTALRCHGLTSDEDCELGWLFLEDAGEERYLSGHEEHRRIAGRWLSALHSSTIPAVAAASLPERGSRYYLEELRSVADVVLNSLDRPAFSADDRTMLRSIVSDCSRLEAHWEHVQRFCDSIPMTLVHGDMVAKNLRVRNGPDGNRLLVLDWEMAGWGIPAADLNELDPDRITYWSVVGSRWSSLDLADLQGLMQLGELFRLITALVWTTWGVDSSQWYLQQIRSYRSRLAAWTRAEKFEFLAGLA